MSSEIYFPTEWEDDERMRVLMGPMPITKDAVALKGRITFWTSALNSWCKTRDNITFTLKDAQMAFRRGTQVPACLSDIIQHLLNQGDLISYESLTRTRNEEKSWAAWSQRLLIKMPSRWAWNIIQTTFGLRNLDNMVFINLGVLQDRCEKVLSSYWSLPGDSVSFNLEDLISVRELFFCINYDVSISLDNLCIVLEFLSSKQRLALIEHQGELLIKFFKPGQILPPSVTERELAEYQLRSTEQKLKERLRTVEAEAKTLREDAKKLVLSGSKHQALSLLRREKRCKKSIDVTFSALENLSACLHKIQEAKLNLDVLSAFHLGANALRSSLAITGTAEDVSGAMDALEEVLDECHDITNTLSSGIQPAESLDDEELELELQRLISDSSLNVTGRSEEAMSLPPVPQNNPLASPNEAQRKKIMEFS